jgi:hypothetical protein
MIDPDAQQEVQPELLPNERILWAGRPNKSVIFHRSDWITVPISLLWGGIPTIVLFSGLLTKPKQQGDPLLFFFVLGIFFVVGQYAIWGRFLHMAWKKGRTFYAITNRRALIVTNSWSRIFSAFDLDRLPAMEKITRRDGIGCIRFQISPDSPTRSNQNFMFWDIMNLPGFVDVSGVDSVYSILMNREGSERQGPWSASGSR